MTMNAYTKLILDSLEGGTVPLSGDLPTYGYLVGGVVSSLIFDPSDDLQPGADIDHFVDYVKGPTVAAEYLGWWTDEETGAVYVDASSWHPDVDKATRVGEERGEIAIFDLTTKNSIYLEG
jgi:hypothetical protein